MPIQPAIHEHAALNIYQAAGCPVGEVGFLQGFGNGRNPVTVALNLFYG
jgi:hypothetical protein